MPRPRTSTPKLRHHRAKQKGVVTLSGRHVYLGHWPADQKSPPAAVRAAYERELAAWLASDRSPKRGVSPDTPAPVPKGTAPTVNDLVAAFRLHAEVYYRRPDGTQTGEVGEFRSVLRELRSVHGTLPTADFTPKLLIEFRDRLVAKGLARSTVNQRTARVVRVWKWGVQHDLTSQDCWLRLTAVEALKEGRSLARETRKKEPADPGLVEGSLPFLTGQPRDLLRCMLLTGARPGEVCRLRMLEVDRTADVWVYRPGQHKTRHRGKVRAIPIGPRCQELLAPYLERPPEAYVFSPKEARAAWEDARGRKRRTPLNQGNRPGTNRVENPRRAPTDRYTTRTLHQAVFRACDRAFPVPEGADADAWHAAHRWHPNQLRHSAATLIRRLFGLEAAQTVLGHAQASITEIYAERDLAKAVEVARSIG